MPYHRPMTLKKIITLPLTLVSLSAFPATYQEYVVSEGDTLSGILFNHQIGPLYGPRGKIQEVLKINKIKKAGDKILSGQKILIPVLFFSSEEKALPIKQKESRLYFQVNFKPTYFRIDSKDKVTGDSASILSELSPEIGASLYFDLDRKNLFRFTVSSLFYSLQKDESILLKNQKGNRTSLSAEYLRNFGSFTSLLGLSMKEELFPFSKTPGELSLEKKVIPHFSAGIIYPFIEKNSTSISGEIGGDYLLSQKNNAYNISSGTRFWSGLKFSHYNHDLGLFFNLSNQQTSIATKKEQQVGLSYSYQFGADADPERKHEPKN